MTLDNILGLTDIRDMIEVPKNRWFYEGFDIVLDLRVDPKDGTVEFSFDVDQDLGKDVPSSFPSLQEAKEQIRKYYKSRSMGVRI